VRFAAAALASLQHATTLRGGARPSGVSCLVVGVDPSGCASAGAHGGGRGRCRVFRTDPSGSCVEFAGGCAVGRGADAAAVVLATAAVAEPATAAEAAPEGGFKEAEAEGTAEADEGTAGGAEGVATRAVRPASAPAAVAAVDALSASEALAASALEAALGSGRAARRRDAGRDASAESDVVSRGYSDGGRVGEGRADGAEPAATPVIGRRSRRLVAVRLVACSPPPWPSRGPGRASSSSSSSGSSGGAAAAGVAWDPQAPHCTATFAPLSLGQAERRT
jgi:hypothetical protein